MESSVGFDRIRMLATYLAHLHCIFYRRTASDRDWIMSVVETAVGQLPGLSNANVDHLVSSPYPSDARRRGALICCLIVRA